MPHRFEIKYLVRTSSLDTIRGMISPFVLAEKNVEDPSVNEYCVRSIYFDTPSLRDYHEKVSGLLIRKKVRLRAYNQGKNGSFAYLEIKRKNNGSIRKERAPVNYSNVQALLETGDVHRYICPVREFPHAVDHASHFLYCLHRERRTPILLVTYEREAYAGRFDASFRLTFDKNLRAVPHSSPFEIYGEKGMRSVLPGYVVIEVKYQTTIPVWFTTLAGKLQLVRRAVSKYCHGIDSIHAMSGAGERSTSIAVARPPIIL